MAAMLCATGGAIPAERVVGLSLITSQSSSCTGTRPSVSNYFCEQLLQSNCAGVNRNPTVKLSPTRLQIQPAPGHAATTSGRPDGRRPAPHSGGAARALQHPGAVVADDAAAGAARCRPDPRIRPGRGVRNEGREAVHDRNSGGLPTPARAVGRRLLA